MPNADWGERSWGWRRRVISSGEMQQLLIILKELVYVLYTVIGVVFL